MIIKLDRATSPWIMADGLTLRPPKSPTYLFDFKINQVQAHTVITLYVTHTLPN